MTNKKDEAKEVSNKKIFKVLSVLTSIFKVFSLIGLAAIVLAFVLIPLIFKNIKINEDTITVGKDVIKYTETSDKITFEYKGDKTVIDSKNEVMAVSLGLDYMRKDNVVAFIETQLFVAGALIVFFILALNKFKKFFNNILEDEVFSIDNISYIRSATKYILYMVITPLVLSVILSLFNMKITISFDITEIYLVLIIYSMTYIFEYGYNKNK